MYYIYTTFKIHIILVNGNKDENQNLQKKFKITETRIHSVHRKKIQVLTPNFICVPRLSKIFYHGLAKT